MHKATLLGESCTNGMGRLLLAEKPKVEELQMDWLRSEDLKEEENVTAPVLIIAVAETCTRFLATVNRRLPCNHELQTTRRVTKGLIL